MKKKMSDLEATKIFTEVLHEGVKKYNKGVTQGRREVLDELEKWCNYRIKHWEELEKIHKNKLYAHHEKMEVKMLMAEIKELRVCTGSAKE